MGPLCVTDCDSTIPPGLSDASGGPAVLGYVPLIAAESESLRAFASCATPPQNDRVLTFRELDDPSELVSLLRLRHRVYVEQCSYGAAKPLGLDLTAHDARSRLFGVFRGELLVGGVRFVFRQEQRHATIMRALHAVAEHEKLDRTSRLLPSEEAFDLVAPLGPRRELIDLEVSRLITLRPGVEPGLVLEIMIATLAAAHLASCRMYLYSCSTQLGPRYARVTNPRWTFSEPVSAGIESDRFAFPLPTIAAVAAVEDSPYLEQALAYADELERTGRIALYAGRSTTQELRLRETGPSSL